MMEAVSIPHEIRQRLEEIKKDFKEGDLTEKGYWRKTCRALEPLLSDSEKKVCQEAETDFQEEILTAKGYCKRVSQILEPILETEEPETAPLKAVEVLATESQVSQVRGKKRSKGNSLVTPSRDQQPLEVKARTSKRRDGVRKGGGGKASTNGIHDEENTEDDSPSKRRKLSESHVPSRKRNGTEQRPASAKKESKTAAKVAEEWEDTEEVASCSQQGTLESTDEVHAPSTYCSECKQDYRSPQFQMFQGDSEDAVEEFIALVDPKVQLSSPSSATNYDKYPQYGLTHFTVYDKNGHLTAFDTGLLENSTELFVSGFIKPLNNEDPSPTGGVECKQMGPVVEWWTSGYNGNIHIGVTTGYADYFLMAPSPSFAPFMDGVKVKCHMSKVVIEFLQEQQDATYGDLLNKLQTAELPAGISCFSEDSLLKHAQYIVDTVQNYDDGGDEDDVLLITTPCMQALIQLVGVTLGQRHAVHKSLQHKRRSKTKATHSKAMVTQLVLNIFDSMFQDQIDSDAEKESRTRRRRRCGICEVCQLSDCGRCSNCRDMVKFGGPGILKQSCLLRKCPNMGSRKSIPAEVDDDDDDEEKVEQYFKQLEAAFSARKKLHSGQNNESVTEWIGSPVSEISKKPFYSAIQVDDHLIRCGDCVSIRPHEPTDPVYIARVQYMYETRNGDKKLHVHWFLRGSDTVLGEVSDPQEVFLTDQCDNVFAESIISQVTVIHKVPPLDWMMQGGAENPDSDSVITDDDGKTFFYQKWYDPEYARFEDPPVVEEDLSDMLGPKFCLSCHRLDLLSRKTETSLETNATFGFRKNGELFRVGDCVYIQPEAFNFGVTLPEKTTEAKTDKKVDEDMYPEAYRKSTVVTGSKEDCPEPFRIAGIEQIICPNSDTADVSEAQIRVRKFYRPENTHLGMELAYQCDLNQVYWSDEEAEVELSAVEGRCRVVCGGSVDWEVDTLFGQGQDVFYFTQAYNPEKLAFEELPPEASSMVANDKSLKESGLMEQDKEIPKLRTLDVFAGCGGLSEGLRQAGVAECLWAIENEGPAAEAFRLNNPKAVVFTDDCNLLLRKAMNGEMTNDQGQKLPLKGDVELLCGGPPCQGFSGMNRFNSREYSLFKNSLIASYLSYCDFFRPRFFMLENVRNFFSFKHSVMLKLTLHCLVRMGYQCTFGVLQAGSYGVAQTRRRAFILAAAPGEKLPSFPEPLYSFSPRAMQTTTIIDNRKYNCVRRLGSAPLRTVTVRDTMSDLPPIQNGATDEEMAYDGEPQTHFQRMIRGKSSEATLRDHVCKEMQPLVMARVGYIPLAPKADWRDLPNIVVRLSDGTTTQKLIYSHDDKQNGRSSTGSLRGVCSCAEGKPCDPIDRQSNTLIPWSLPHTGNRHTHWSGLYGRLSWEEFFSVTVTNPEPMGKQGRVLHPEQHRVVSVRECARSQGFPDSYRFSGSIYDRHKQVGNAVPPPLAKCIGLEIRKSLEWHAQQQKVEDGMHKKTQTCCKENTANGKDSNEQKNTGKSCVRVLDLQKAVAEPNDLDTVEQKAVAEPNDLDTVEQKAVAEPNDLDTVEQKAVAEPNDLDTVEQKAVAEPSDLDTVEQKAVAEPNDLDTVEQKAVAEPNDLDTVEQKAVAEPNDLDTVEINGVKTTYVELIVDEDKVRTESNLEQASSLGNSVRETCM